MEENKPNNTAEGNKPNNNEQQLNTHSTDEPIATTAKTTEVEQARPTEPSGRASTFNPQTLNPDMEVHHHAHDPAVPHHKKNWKSYFWEFLMLFLAVFCGFLAEYQLEHTIEKQKETEYIKSMNEDLQNDTAKLNKVSSSLMNINKSIDTIFLYYNDIGTGTNPVLLKNLKAINGFPTFFYSDRTIQQLKNSGGLRLIKDKIAANGIMEYDATIRNYENNATYVQRYWERLTELRLNIIDWQSLDSLISNSSASKIELKYLITNDPIALRKFKNLIYELQFYHRNTIRDNTRLIEKATVLMQALRTQYNLQ